MYCVAIRNDPCSRMQIHMASVLAIVVKFGCCIFHIESVFHKQERPIWLHTKCLCSSTPTWCPPTELPPLETVIGYSGNLPPGRTTGRANTLFRKMPHVLLHCHLRILQQSLISSTSSYLRLVPKLFRVM